MTISAEERRAAMKRVLVRLADLCGDEREIKFGEADLVEASPLRTTIGGLEEAKLVEQVVMSSNPEAGELRDDVCGLERFRQMADVGAVRGRGARAYEGIHQQHTTARMATSSGLDHGGLIRRSGRLS
jgi:hypothetical protein